jgi:phosphohistidine phosphatase
VKVLLVRHAIAEDAPAFRGADRDRPLSEEGRRRFRRGAEAIAAQVPELALVATSPLVRARQTAEMIVAASPRAGLDELGALAPGGEAREVLTWLSGRRDAAAVALVGHEPDLSRLEGLLLAGRGRTLAEFRKGGAALLDFPERIAAGGAVLVWHLTAGQLRELAP